MRVKGDRRKVAAEEETREDWQEHLPTPLCGPVSNLWSVPRAELCEQLQKQSKCSCPDSIQIHPE
jgi:hypothetical protein